MSHHVYIQTTWVTLKHTIQLNSLCVWLEWLLTCWLLCGLKKACWCFMRSCWWCCGVACGCMLAVWAACGAACAVAACWEGWAAAAAGGGPLIPTPGKQTKTVIHNCKRLFMESQPLLWSNKESANNKTLVFKLWRYCKSGHLTIFSFYLNTLTYIYRHIYIHSRCMS